MKSRQTRLDALGDIRGGLTQRTQAGSAAIGLWRVVLGRHAEDRIIWKDLPTCPAVRGIERQALEDGDVLVTLRTTDVRAVAATHVPPHTVASSQFAVLRPRPELVDPRYLAWALNRAEARARLRTLFKGSSIPFLPVADLASFEIALPDLDRQRAIARVIELRSRDAELRQQLDKAFDVLMDVASRTSDTN